MNSKLANRKSQIIMANKLINNKFYVAPIIKSHLLNISNALFEHIKSLYKIISNNTYNRSLLSKGYMREYNLWFKQRMLEFYNIQSSFINFPYYYNLLENFAYLLRKADKQKYKERRSIDFDIIISVRNIFNLVRQQLNTIP